MSFWDKLSHRGESSGKGGGLTSVSPFFCLAPMADVTDAAFRRIVAKYSKKGNEVSFPTTQADHKSAGGGLTSGLSADCGLGSARGETSSCLVLWTEQVSCDGLCHPKGKEKLLTDLRFSEMEHPIVAQLFGSKPENFRKAVPEVLALGFDGIDINMGCPDQSINKQGAGAAIIKTPKLAREVLRAAQEVAGDKPVSIKTRIGYNSIITEEWIGEIMQEHPAAITIHGRTKKEMSKVPAHWDEIGRAAEIIHKHNPDIKVIGNGDVKSIAEGREKVEKYKLDGIMIGRGVFGNPWLFNSDVKKEDLSPKEVARVMLEHTKLFEELYTGIKSFAVMKKHFGAYVAGLPKAKELKTALMLTNSANEAEGVLKDYGIC